MKRLWNLPMLLLAGVFVTASAAAFDAVSVRPQAGVAGQAAVRVMFTPGEDAAGEIIRAIGAAQRQVLVQAYSFTHDEIAGALVEAHRRGIEVKVLADRVQTEKMQRGQVPGLARAGLPVWLDGAHQGAHNKVMVIDAGTRQSLIITGSYNFTRAAQHKNAENVVFISGNDALAEAYASNWQAHLQHAKPLTLH